MQISSRDPEKQRKTESGSAGETHDESEHYVGNSQPHLHIRCDNTVRKTERGKRRILIYKFHNSYFP